MRTTRALAITCAVVMTAALTGCQDETEGPGNSAGTAPTGPVPSGDAPTHTGIATPTPEWTDNVDKSQLERGHTNDNGEWIAPSHDVATYAYGHAEANLRGYFANLPKRRAANTTVPDEVTDYTSSAYEENARMTLANANGGTIPSDDGSYSEVEYEIISITPHDWYYRDNQGGRETVILDVCRKSEIRRYDPNGKEKKSYDQDGNPLKPVTTEISRYIFDHQSGWLIDDIKNTGKKCG